MVNLKDLRPLFEDNEIIASFDLAQDQINIFYKHFVNDFIENPLVVKSKNVKIFAQNSKIKQFSNYAETFVHVVTREIKSENQRFYECNRANRIHWIKPILTSPPCGDILYYKWKDERGRCKDHYWFYEKDFMVVLKEFKPDMQIVTAFCVDNDEKLKFYERYRDYKTKKWNF